MADAGLRAARAAIVQEHMDTEASADFEATIRTFTVPRYEIMPTGEDIDGVDGLRAFYHETHVAFPDFHFENTTLHHVDDGVIVETDFIGTHAGPWRGMPPTNRVVRYRMCNVFVFDGVDLVCERLHFDRLTILIQLGIARDPTTLAGRLTSFFNHPVHVTLSFLRGLMRD